MLTPSALTAGQEFIKRTGDFAVMIGLCLRGSPVLGVVHAPAQEVPKTHYAVAGKGAFVVPGDDCGEGLGRSERIRCLCVSALVVSRTDVLGCGNWYAGHVGFEMRAPIA